MQDQKLINIIRNLLIFILWSIIPILISYLGWKLILPYPISTIEVSEPKDTSINQLIAKAGWFTENINKPKPVEISNPPVNNINNNYNLLGIYLRNKKPAMALVNPKNGGNSELIVEGKNSRIGINLLRAINPYEIEVEDSQGNASILKINRNQKLPNLFKKGNQKTKFSDSNIKIEPQTNNKNIQTITQSKVNNSDTTPKPTNKTDDQTISNALTGEVNAFLSTSRGFAALSPDKQAEVRELLKNPTYLQRMQNDKELFEGLMNSYQQLN